MGGAFVMDGDAAEHAVRGFSRAHSRLVGLVEDPLYLYSKARNPGRRVGLVSGGGSGHEPLHIGFLGRGMLDAVAPGRIFASPHNRQVYDASRACAGPGGVLHIVKNYTGDRINFGIAAERLALAGIEVRRVLVDDDIASETTETATGRRGTAAAVIVEKVLGAAADDGLDVDALAELGGAVAASSRSVAVAGRAQRSMQSGEPAFHLRVDELEYGVGIHGERAATTIARPALSTLVERMCTEILAKLPPSPAQTLLMVNGLGAATQLELYGVFELAEGILTSRGWTVSAALVGTFVPAMDMHGFSITVTRLEPPWLKWFDRPVETPSYPSGGTA